MKDKAEFFKLLRGLQGQKIDELDNLLGDFDFSRFILKCNGSIELAGEPSRPFILQVPQAIAGFPQDLFNSAFRKTALEDYLTRRAAECVEGMARFDDRGIARRHIRMIQPQQAVLPRSSVSVNEEFVELRLCINLPIPGGFIDSAAVADIFTQEIPVIVNDALIYCNLDATAVAAFVNLMEDAELVRKTLPKRGWVGFVGEGAIPARQPESDLPEYDVLRGISLAPELASEITGLTCGTVRGWGIPAGITLILGDAYSGRTELVRAIAAGIYNHIPGDGRDFIITSENAVYIAASEGRVVRRVDLRPFVQEHASGQDVRWFSTEHADARVAQAAETAEMLEAGAQVLLFDESDSSAEFLGRDPRLAGIFPLAGGMNASLAECAPALVHELGLSLVVGGFSAVSQFIPIATTILRIEEGRLTDVTHEAKKAVPGQEHTVTADVTTLSEHSRWVVPTSIEPGCDVDGLGAESSTVKRLQFGRQVFSLDGVTQLAENSQAVTISRILWYIRAHYLTHARPLREMLDLVDRDLGTEGLDILGSALRGDLARPRRFEIAMAINRLASMRVVQAERFTQAG